MMVDALADIRTGDPPNKSHALPLSSHWMCCPRGIQMEIAIVFAFTFNECCGVF
jgi:hypothetical protein